MKVAYLLAAAGACLLITSSASAAKKTFVVEMSPDQENVEPDLGDHDPTGTLTATFDDQTKRLCGKIEFSDLTGAAMGVHIHRAPEGDPTGDGTMKIEITPTASPVNFNVVLSDDFITALNQEETELYSNIHTATNPKGELRTFTPWDQPDDATEIPCGPETPVGDAGAPSDAGSTSSSSSSSSSSSGSSSAGDDDDDDDQSSTSTGAKDAGAAAKKKPEGGCSTTGDASGLSFAVVLGVGVAALARGRRKRRP